MAFEEAIQRLNRLKKKLKMITIKLPFKNKLDPEMLEVINQWNNALRYSFNRFKKSPELKETEVSRLVKDRMSGLDLLDASLIEAATNKAKQTYSPSKTTTFGGKFNWRSFINGLISKEEWKLLRNSPLQFKGRKNKSEKGNRKFKLKVIEENSIWFNPSKNLKFKLDLPKLKKDYKKSLFLLQELCESGEASFTCSVSHTHVHISFEEEILKEKEYSDIENRIISIDLNPNYLGIIIADYSDSVAVNVLHKEVVSIKELNDLEFKLNKI